MKGQLKVSTPAEYLAQLEEPRKSDVAALDALIRTTVKLEPFIHSGMLAYGSTRLKYANGREEEWFLIGVASNASYISLYVMGSEECGSGVERFKEALPKAKIGKCCVRFKRLSDLDQSALKKMLADAMQRAATA